MKKTMKYKDMTLEYDPRMGWVHQKKGDKFFTVVYALKQKDVRKILDTG